MVGKNIACVGGVGGRVIGLSEWFIHFGSTIVLTSWKEVGILDNKTILNLPVWYSDTTIASSLISIITVTTIYSGVETKLVWAIKALASNYMVDI